MAHENRLAQETSPYLLQHKANPVDWYPWGDEAFAKAKREDKPILLSVGYSACHWCHVMERESFEDPEIARLMNDWFVSVKVDREERPDVDHLYMQAVQAMTGQGGWPMTVFLTPDGVPFHGGTYFPPEDRHGIAGFPKVLQAIAEIYRNRRADALEAGRELVEQLRQGERVRVGQDLLTEEIAHSAAVSLGQAFDARDGGLGGAPKFPQSMAFDFLLRYWHRTGRGRVLDMVKLTLTRMARGGMYDQLGGGFHRYSVDQRWLVPHFEKMLYDNAQLARLYLDAWLATGDPEYRRIAEETLDYVLREMTDPSGGFYSTQDADSEGQEGKFFLWRREEIEAALGERDEARAACRYWGVDDGPNFEERNILFVPRDRAIVAQELGLAPEDLGRILTRARSRLFQARERRAKPGRDEKVLAGWNGLMLRAFAEAARVLGRADYERVAVRNAEFVLTAMRRDGRLSRSCKDGQARLLGYLEDYAMVADGLLALYQAVLDRRWLGEALGLAEEMIRLFWDPEVQGFFDTGLDHEVLVARPRNLFDNAVPSGSAVAADVLLRLAVLTGGDGFEKKGAEALRSVAPLLGRYASGFGRWLAALDFHLGPRVEVALVWPAGSEKGREPFLAEVFHRYQPRLVIAGMVAGGSARGIPLLEGKGTVDGNITAYLCENYACQAPTTDPGELRSQLAALRPAR